MKDDPITPTEIQLTRWMDSMPGAVPPENLNPQETARLRADAEAVAALLRKHVPTSVEPPYPDFFNAQLLKRIRDDGTSKSRRAIAGGPWAGLTSWWRSPWLTGAATAIITVAAMHALHTHQNRSALVTGTRVLSVFSPEPNATATVITVSDASALIISIDGLDPFPADRVVVGDLNDASDGPLVAVLAP